jgi:HK97 family phage major capsid protein
MSDTNTQNAAETPKPSVMDTITKMATSVSAIGDRLGEVEGKLNGLEGVNYPNGAPNGGAGGDGAAAFHIRKGEDPLSSRGYSLTRLAKSLAMRAANSSEWREHAKLEHDLSARLQESYYGNANWEGYKGASGTIIPLGSELMPTEERKVEMADGKQKVIPGMSKELVKECRDSMTAGVEGYDLGELASVFKSAGLSHMLRKDLSAHDSSTGGILVNFPQQGELIELLRAREVFSRAGASEIDLPPQGSIRWPRQNSSVTVAATYEGATVGESTPGFGGLTLQAKPYSGFTDIPEELLRFATSIAVEAWLRSEFTRELALKAAQDQLTGAGGIAIKGIFNYGSIRTVVASSPATHGDTLDPEDPLRLYADIADQNAPVDNGFFYAMTNTLWAALATRKASTSGEFMFNIATQFLGGGMPRMSMNGFPVITSTQMPTDRVKGNGTTLTSVLGGVPSEWMVARAGVVEIAMTNSDGDKFKTRTSTMRGTQYIDAGPRHENAFGIIDDLLEA